MKLRKAIVIGLIVGVHSIAATAQVARTEDAIRYRKAVMVMIKWHYDRLAQMAKGSVPFTRDEVDRNAARLEALSKNVAEGFVAGSHEGDTRAQAAIWSDSQKFHGAIERFQADAAKLRETARKGDAAAVKTQLDAMTKSCKACHDDFKKS